MCRFQLKSAKYLEILGKWSFRVNWIYKCENTCNNEFYINTPSYFGKFVLLNQKHLNNNKNYHKSKILRNFKKNMHCVRDLDVNYTHVKFQNNMYFSFFIALYSENV